MPSDFGNSYWRTARKPHQCGYCAETILQGEKHYQFTGIWEGEWQNWRMHGLCYLVHDLSQEETFDPGEANRATLDDLPLTALPTITLQLIQQNQIVSQEELEAATVLRLLEEGGAPPDGRVCVRPRIP